MKQTFEIPEGCKTVSVEQVGNQLITTFEQIKYVPKVGDCVKITNRGGDFMYCVIKKHNSKNYLTEAGSSIQLGKVILECSDMDFMVDVSFEKLTKDQLQSEFEKLGYVYDFETHTASKKRWRSKDGCSYYKLDSYLNPLMMHENYSSADFVNYENFNYFQTEKQAEEAAKFIKQQLKEFLNK